MTTQPLDDTIVHDGDGASGPRPALALIEGSGPNLSAEISETLRERLLVASSLLAAGYGAFLVKGWLLPSPDIGSALKWAQAAVALLTALVAQRLYVQCRHTLAHLRLAELLVFGGSALFFAVLSFSTIERYSEVGAIPPINQPWMLLIFTYALLIPNSWRRALCVIAPLAAAPVAVLLAARVASPQVADAIRNDPLRGSVVLETTMVSALSATIAVWGVYVVRSLRRQAFEARRLGQYQLKQLIGAGAMGEVHIGEHVLLKRPCAIKLIRPEKAGDPQVLARFEREVRETARLSHWNTVEIYDFGRADGGVFYYVMEYLPGMNLDQIVRQCGPMPPERVIHLLTQTCDALSEAHAEGLIHRDIKPANIFAARRGRKFDVAKLLDFGLVRQAAQDEGTNLTQEHSTVGSPLYMSPEQAVGDAVERRSDIYALGAAAYFLLTGRPPFEGDRPLKIMMAHASAAPEPPSTHAPVPRDLESVVLRCLAKSPADRFDDVDQLQRALRECEDAGRWGWDEAEKWWNCNGCPAKKALDLQICGPGGV